MRIGGGIMTPYGCSMRITIDIDKDLLTRLKRLKKTRPFKEFMNDVLRLGLDKIENTYTIAPVEGRPRRMDLDNVEEILGEEDEVFWRLK